LGVKPDSRVAISAERGLEMTLGLLAILKAGGAYVPLDPAYPAERLNYMLQDSGPTALLTQSHLLQQFAGLGDTLPIIDMAVVNPPWQNQPETNPDPASVGLTSGHIAYIIYTSGSTGVPKGAMIQHRNVNNLACAQQHIFGVSDSDRILQFFSFSFDVSMFAIVMALSSGARMVLAKGEELLPGPALIGLLQREGITVATLPPAVLSYLPEAELPELRTVILGGESWNEELVERWGEGRRVFNSYGPTETTVQATVKEHRAGDGKPNIGRPMRNVRIYLLDAEGNPVPVGTSGELHIGGAGLGRGYLDNALTGERFVPDPFSGNAGGRLYRTGDWARWLPDGNIDLLGRKDEQVKIRGFRIELGEIGARLMEYAGVREAAVIAREDTPGDNRLVSYYTCAETTAEGQGGAVVVGAELLRAHLSGRLPEYMVPAAYVRVQSLPLTPHGKLDHKALPAPDGDSYAAQGYEAPQGKVETTLAAIWSDVLKLERIGRHDNFFALGGHSLLTFRVVNLLAQEGISIQAADIFTHPTIDSLSAKIGLEGMRALADRAVCIRKDGTQPPLFLTHCGSGELLYLAALAPHIDTSVPIYGLPHRLGDEAQLRTVEGMAIRMVQMIRAVQPVGPYHIAGWSFGGVLAYEIAVQLIGADQEVAFLGMLDTSYPARERNLSERRVEDFTDIDLLLSAVRAGKARDQEQQAAISEIESAAGTMNFAALVQKCRQMALLPDILEGFTASQIQQLLIRQRGLMAASRAYSVQPLPIPVHLFAATEGNPVDPVCTRRPLTPIQKAQADRSPHDADGPRHQRR